MTDVFMHLSLSVFAYVSAVVAATTVSPSMLSPLKTIAYLLAPGLKSVMPSSAVTTSPKLLPVSVTTVDKAAIAASNAVVSLPKLSLEFTLLP
ncbi:MAG: hypothetical protein BWY74_01358 [Firmicutes bacterium ADurb.Bin419]|nr:MAG: hypothetical protein BWY74_01358 [Firmicutes bacterium ADurb.Bin419]